MVICYVYPIQGDGMQVDIARSLFVIGTFGKTTSSNRYSH